MRDLRTLTRLAALTLAAVGLGAAPASADIHSGTSGSYSGPIKGSSIGSHIFESGGITITCAGSTFDGFLEGDAPATAELSFTWNDCSASSGGGGVPCSVSDLVDAPFAITEENAPDATFVSASWEMDAVCGLVYGCHWSSSDPAPVAGEFDSDTQILSFDETGLDVAGGFGCTGEGRWVGDYLVTDLDDQPLDLFATGTE